MKLNKKWLVGLLFLAIGAIYFWPTIFKGWLPFPGKMLVGSYAPYNAHSFLGYAPGGVPHKAQGSDVARMFFPWKSFSIESLKNGFTPLWNPHAFSGNPHLANFQTGIFYPLNLLFWLFRFNLAWSAFIIFQPILACLFTYWFAREIKVSRWGSILAGLSFGYSLYLTVWLEWGNLGHSLLWLPLSLLLVEKLINQDRLVWWCLLVGSMVFSIFAGYIQTSLYLMAVVFAFFVFRSRDLKSRQRIQKLGLLLAAYLMALILSAVQLLPTWEIFLQSARGVYSSGQIKELLLPPVHLISIFVPDFFGNPASRNYWFPGTYIERVTYVGVLPLFFALLAIFYQKSRAVVRFLIGLTLVALAMSVDWPGAWLFFRLKLPIIGTGVPTRVLFLVSFALSILAGIGLDAWLENKRRKQFFKPILVFAGFYLALWLATFLIPRAWPGLEWSNNLAISQRNLIIPTGLVGALGALTAGGFFLKEVLKKIPLITPAKGGSASGGNYLLLITSSAIILLTTFDLFFYFQKITPFSPPEFVYPITPVTEFLKNQEGHDRFWGYGVGYIDSNLATQLGAYSVEGYDPLFSRRYGELISVSKDGQIKKPLPRSDVALEKGFGQESLRENIYRQRLLNLLGVKYLLQKDESLTEEWRPDYQTFPEETYRLVWQQGQWQVYQNKAALPRAFLVGDFVVETDEQAIVDRLLDPEFSLEEKVLLEKAPLGSLSLDSQASGGAEIIDYQPNRVVISTNSQSDKLLVLSDNYFPGWKARIDGQPSKIFRADYSFRALMLPGGEHRVEFIYDPLSFKIGLVVSGAGLSFLMLIILKYAKKNQ